MKMKLSLENALFNIVFCICIIISSYQIGIASEIKWYGSEALKEEILDSNFISPNGVVYGDFEEFLSSLRTSFPNAELGVGVEDGAKGELKASVHAGCEFIQAEDNRKIMISFHFLYFEGDKIISEVWEKKPDLFPIDEKTRMLLISVDVMDDQGNDIISCYMINGHVFPQVLPEVFEPIKIRD